MPSLFWTLFLLIVGLFLIFSIADSTGTALAPLRSAL